VKKRETKEALTITPMLLSGLVKTEKGYAVATAELSPTGSVLRLDIGPSQAYPQFVALEHKRLLSRLSSLCLTGRLS
jgi:hypothetical protein